MTVPSKSPFVVALVTMLRTEMPVPFGDGEPPVDEPVPYGIVYSIEGGQFGGPPLIAPDADAQFVVQVNCVGERRDQAESMLDGVRGLILGRDASGAFNTAITAPTGWVIAGRWSDGGPAGVDYEGRPPSRLFTARERFVLAVTPE